MLNDTLNYLSHSKDRQDGVSEDMNCKLQRYRGNPILKPIKSHVWESAMTYNCAAVYEDGRIHLVYRARGTEAGVSRFGYASTNDGFKIDYRESKPIFEPSPNNELETLGCEDPRLTRIGQKLYMCYTAFGRVPCMLHETHSIQVAMTSIDVEDFLGRLWSWDERIYPFPRVDNKNACLFPEKIGGRWVMYHRIPPHVWVAYSDNLKEWYGSRIVMSPKESWEYFKLGAGPPPVKTKEGWLFIYHAVDSEMRYRLGLALIDPANPEKVKARCKDPILEPEENYEVEGVVPQVVFSCGAVTIDDVLYVYYGGADTVIGVATAKISELLDSLLN